MPERPRPCRPHTRRLADELLAPPFELPPLDKLPPGVNASMVEELVKVQREKEAAKMADGTPHGEAIMDSGATYTHMPRAAWKKFMVGWQPAAGRRCGGMGCGGWACGLAALARRWLPRAA